jgi:hypothetical protein
LTETLAPTDTLRKLDALSEVLRVVKLDSAIFCNAECSEPWCLCSPEARTIAPMLARRATRDRLSPVVRGSRHARLEDAEPVALEAGDLVTFPPGHGHVLGNGRTSTMIDGGGAPGRPRQRPAGDAHGRRRSAVVPICGYLVCDPQMSQTPLAAFRR